MKNSLEHLKSGIKTQKTVQTKTKDEPGYMGLSQKHTTDMVQAHSAYFVNKIPFFYVLQINLELAKLESLS
jgi:hypothetical protein